jgi:hypothetical protein
MREIRLLDMEAIRLKVAPYFSGNRFPLTSLSGAH